MKKLLLLVSVFFLSLAFVAQEKAAAQGATVNSTAINLKRDSDTTLRVYTPAFFGNARYVTVGTLYTTASALDTVCTVLVKSALTQSPLNSGYGQLVNDTTKFHHDNSAATAYREETLSFPAGVNYLSIIVDRDTAASANGKVQVFIKPGN